MSTIRVLLVDDHAILRAGVRALLEPHLDLEVVGEAATGEEAEALARELRPDLVVMDLSMPGCGGIEATRRVRRRVGAPEVLVLTMGSETEHLLPSTEAGAIGFLRKECAEAELLEAVRTVAAGRPYFGAAAARILVQHYRQGRTATAEEDPIALLSERERQVLAAVAAGYTSSDIGRQLRISPKTVDTYRSRIQGKLGLQRRSELVRLAVRHNLLPNAA